MGYENSDEFPTAQFPPAGAAAVRADKTRRAFPKERRSTREVACGRIFATGAAAGLSVEKKC